MDKISISSAKRQILSWCAPISIPLKSGFDLISCAKGLMNKANSGDRGQPCLVHLLMLNITDL